MTRVPLSDLRTPFDMLESLELRLCLCPFLRLSHFHILTGNNCLLDLLLDNRKLRSIRRIPRSLECCFQITSTHKNNSKHKSDDHMTHNELLLNSSFNPS